MKPLPGEEPCLCLRCGLGFGDEAHARHNPVKTSQCYHVKCYLIVHELGELKVQNP